MKVLITGATGFIGSALAPHLASLGHYVTALVRHPIDLPGVHTVDFNDISAFSLAHAEGQDVVIHCAGVAHDNDADDSLYHHVNVVGTEAVTRHCVQAGVRRLVYLSSIKVHGDTSSKPLNEHSALHPDDAYGRSKLEAERIVLAQSTIEAIVVRIPLVYGAGVKGNFAALMKWVAMGLPLPFGAVTARRSYLALDNLLDFLAMCIQVENAQGSVLYACDDPALTLPELLGLIAMAMDKPARMVPVPLPLLRAAATLLLGAKRAGKLLNNLEIDLAETTRQTGWRPPYSTAQSLARMFGHPPQP